jgi:hypothetical protein
MLLAAMGIDSVKHLQSLTKLLSNVMAEPLGLAHPPLMKCAAEGTQSVILNGWPRVKGHRGEIMRGVSLAWIRCCEDSAKKGVQGIMRGLKELVGMLDVVLIADEEVKDVWAMEKRELVEADERLRGLLFDEM